MEHGIGQKILNIVNIQVSSSSLRSRDQLERVQKNSHLGLKESVVGAISLFRRATNSNSVGVAR